MDIIELKAIQLKAKIGVYAFEQKHPQKLIIDLCYAVPVKAAAETDDLKQTLDYDAIIEHLKDFVSHHQFNLIETLAERFTQSFFEKFNSPWIRLSINKPCANLKTKATILTIERTADA